MSTTIRHRLAAPLVTLGLGWLAASGGVAHAQLDPGVRLGRATTGVYQYLGGSWGWERVQVGEIYVEPDGLGGGTEHWALFRDYDPALPLELAPSSTRYAGLEDFLTTVRAVDAATVAVEDRERRCEPTPTCVTLTRGNADVADALIRQSEPERNFGGSGSLTVSDGGGGVRRALVRFDTDRIPRGARVVSADLVLHGLLYGAATSVYPVMAPWREESVTWASFVRSGEPLGAGLAGPYLDRTTAVMPLAPAGGVASTSLIALVQGWVDGAVPNFGLMLGRRVMEGTMVYASSESPDPALRPQLTVCYQACADRCDHACEGGDVCAAGACRPPDILTCEGTPAEEACSGHGVVAFGRCFCEPGWEGRQCEAAIGCPSDCSGQGQCLHGQCYCEPGFSGEACEVATACPDGCSGNGVCMYGACFCVPGYTGPACADPLRT